jgi:hypothetical protein
LSIKKRTRFRRLWYGLGLTAATVCLSSLAPHDGAGQEQRGWLGQGRAERATWPSEEARAPEIEGYEHPLLEQSSWCSVAFLEAGQFFEDRRYKQSLRATPDSFSYKMLQKHEVQIRLRALGHPMSLITYRTGWPFRCTEGYRFGTMNAQGEFGYSYRWLVRLYSDEPGSPAKRGLAAWFPNPYLPLGPLWIGLVLDVACWSAFAFITSLIFRSLGRTVRAQRGRRRVRRGACPNCGFNRAGISSDVACPECGHAGPAPL